MLPKIIRFIWLLGLLPQLLSAGTAPALNLMPWPAEIQLGTGKFYINDSFRVDIRGRADARLYRYATRILRLLSGRTGLFFPQDYLRPDLPVDSATLVIYCQRPGKIQLHEDESYQLTVDERGIRLKAKTSLGAMRGLETFLQLLSADEHGYYFPYVEINDRPRFPWRGLLIDVARHFMPVEVIKRNLDGMAAVKLNVLHWHLSDDQGFRVECKTFPKLHQLGSDGFYYTQEQIKEIIEYAADRGIRVVPEFDVPGHATSWLVAYPEIGSAPGPYQIERKWGIFYPALNPANKKTHKFLDKFFKEMARLFPDPYFHIGGDELEAGDYHKAKHWDENSAIQKLKKKKHLKNNAALQAYFNQKVLKILTKYGKIMVGWDEILHPDMPRSIVIQSWRGRDSMIKAARMGYRSILSNGYYIDLIFPASRHYLNDPLPADIPLTEEQQKLILGGEATMWAEYVSPETIDSRIWPRTAAIAERLWSPREVNDVDDMYRRLENIRFQLEERNLTHEKNYAMMLRRLTRYRDITPLKTLVDVIEPVKGYRRGQLRDYTSYSPLTRVVDAARPDATVARNFRNLVNRYLCSWPGDSTAEEEIRHWLNRWQENHARLEPIIRTSPILWEIRSLSQDLSEVAALGLQALETIQSGKSLSDSLTRHAQELLQQAAEPHAQTELMIVPAIKKLIQRASSGARKKENNNVKSNKPEANFEGGAS